MKVVILGGYGVFGARLGELLLRDGHEVWIAGRDLRKAEACAQRLGAHPLRVDLRGDLQPAFSPRPDVVVDAVGPYQCYGEDPYRVARACIEAGTNYLDLSDDADFTAGIAAVDRAARRAGCRALSGASSVPGLSSIVVEHLARDFEELLLIDTAILPGNRAPRGVSVIESIVGQVGRVSPVWRGGIWRDTRCWTDRRRFDLGPDLKRTGYFISVPDIKLFPAFFKARSVMFRAGMELGLFNAALSALGWLKQHVSIEITPRRARVFQWVSKLFLSFGTDRGAMQVVVAGKANGAVRERVWRLTAEAGDGPYVPVVVARALIGRLEDVPIGARPCLCEAALPEIEEALSDLKIETAAYEDERRNLFQIALGEYWSTLRPEARALHSVQDVESFSGTAQVIRGSSLPARLTGWIFGFPTAGHDVPLTVTKTRTDSGEIWERNFDGRIFRSYLTPATEPYRCRERFWPFTFELDLPVKNGSMYLLVRRGWVLGLPIPRPFLPGSDSCEYVKNGKFHFDVALSAPLGQGLIVRYRGSLVPDGDKPVAMASVSRSQ
ncbi:MAG: DUF4166 domain-containing protein [Hyphomicrobiaceae bacterium]|nr:DUF4166 domain-containing protein [Hyphomicrobiaceae bacterium]